MDQFSEKVAEAAQSATSSFTFAFRSSDRSALPPPCVLWSKDQSIITHIVSWRVYEARTPLDVALPASDRLHKRGASGGKWPPPS